MCEGPCFVCMTWSVLSFLLLSQLTDPHICILKHFEVVILFSPTALQIYSELPKQRCSFFWTSQRFAMPTSKWTIAIKISILFLRCFYPASQGAGRACQLYTFEYNPDKRINREPPAHVAPWCHFDIWPAENDDKRSFANMCTRSCGAIPSIRANHLSSLCCQAKHLTSSIFVR